jgi:hypothetical protein
MTEAGFHSWLTRTELILAGATFLLLLVVAAPYGRHQRPGWGPSMANAAGWVVMELPAVLLFTAIHLTGEHRFEPVPLAFAGLWLFHYLQRTFVFPFRLHTTGKKVPVVIVAMGFAFNVLNAYVIARWTSHLGRYDTEWLLDPRFITGVALFFAGFAINQRADAMLIGLRRAGETGYRVPSGWLYEYVACPNYLGEIVEWTGFAIATWSLPGLAFALFTAANVGPRAYANLRWYRATFPDYPPDRKALIPFVV